MSIVSAVRTILVDRALPYRVHRVIQHACVALGSRERTVRCRGLRFRVRRLTSDEAFVTNVVANNEYLQHGITLNASATVIDVGGNIGAFAILAGSMLTTGRVISIEPDPDNLRLLRANVRLNRVPVTVIAAAVSSRAGTTTLHHSAEGGGFHSLDPHYAGRTFDRALTVTTVTLADVLLDGRCDLLKMDCEGAEFDIVAGTPPAMLRRIDQVAMEYHAVADDPRVAELCDRLTDADLILAAHERFPTRGGHLFFRRGQ